LKIEASVIREEKKHRDQKAKITDTIDDKRFLARVSIGLVTEPVADKQIRAEAHPFPADEQDGEVGAEHQDEHEKDEQIQICEVARIAWVIAHISDAEHVDQGAHARDDQQHHQRELVDHQCGVDAQVTGDHPREVALDEGLVRSARPEFPEDHRRQEKGENEDRGPDDAGDARKPMSRRDVMLVAMCAR
jgi:hypothetical protein